MAAAESAVNGCMDVLAACGLSAAALEPSPIALARGFARHYRREADQQTARVVIDLGGSSTKVMILRGHQVCFYRRLDLGGAAMTEALAAKLNITPVEAAALRRQVGVEADPAKATAVSDAVRGVLAEIAREVGLCLRYYSVTFRGNRPEHIHVCGGEAHGPLVAGVFEKELGSGVEIADPLDGLDLSDPTVRIERRGRLSEWALVCGLALRAPHMAMRGAA
jgi:type IV pilus assembly protein PilM